MLNARSDSPRMRNGYRRQIDVGVSIRRAGPAIAVKGSLTGDQLLTVLLPERWRMA